MKDKRKIILISLVTLTILYILLIYFVDVKAIGPENSSVGFATINGFFHNLLPYNELFYKLSKYLGYLSFLLIIFYACIGLYQLIKYKDFSKVDKRIKMLGVFYVVVLITYFFFEKFPLNYRPVILDEGLEASFPSSHTMLALCVCLSAIIINKYIKFKELPRKIFNIGIIALMIAIVLTRFLSGVHWFTDIIGGILISCILVYIYYISVTNKKSTQ